MLIPSSPKTARWLGFTLIEVMVALFIFALITVILSAALHSMMTAQSATEKNAQRLSQAQMALLLFSRDLEQALDRPISDPNGNIEGSFLGSKQSLTFTHRGFASASRAANKSNLQRTRYRIDKDQFIRDTWTQLDQLPQTSFVTRPLLGQITHLHFRYLDDKKVYHLEWPPDSASPAAGLRLMPRAVEINLTIANWGSLQQTIVLSQQGESLQNSPEGKR